MSTKFDLDGRRDPENGMPREHEAAANPPRPPGEAAPEPPPVASACASRPRQPSRGATACIGRRRSDPVGHRLRDRQCEREDGTLQQLGDYWIKGGGTRQRPPRWCVMRDMLHWLP